MSHYSEEMKRRIYDTTGGYCHLCGKQLSFENYHKPCRRGAWHIDHSYPKSRGGVDDLRNLRPACIDCNVGKSDQYSWDYRREIGASGKGFLVCSRCGSTNLSTKFLGTHHTWDEGEYFYKCRACGHLGKGRGRLRPEER